MNTVEVRDSVNTERRLYGGPADGKVIGADHLHPNKPFRYRVESHTNPLTTNQSTHYDPQRYQWNWGPAPTTDRRVSIRVIRYIHQGADPRSYERQVLSELLLGAYCAVLLTWNRLL